MEEKIKCPKCDNLTSKFYVEIDGMCWQCKKKKDLEWESNYAIENEGTTSDDFIVCPYCGEDYGTDDMHETTNCDCDGCGKKFHVEIEYSTSYTTSKVNK